MRVRETTLLKPKSILLFGPGGLVRRAVRVELLAEAALSKALRPILHGLTSRDRLSPLRFRQIAKELSAEFNGGISFVTGHDWESWADKPSIRGSRVVILGNSDRDWRFDDLPDWPDVTFFVQNYLDGESDRIKVLPIGVEDFVWARNAMPWNFRKSLIGQDKKLMTLVGPFGPTHPSRNELLEISKGLESAVALQGRMPSWRYSSVASGFMFIACPRGNGFDTHRFWETLYRGSIPVVLESKWSRDIARQGVPVVQLSDWSQINEISNLPEVDPTRPQYLEPSWWENRFRNILSAD